MKARKARQQSPRPKLETRPAKVCIVDTGVLVAALDANDPYSNLCAKILLELYDQKVRLVVPPVCLSEADHLLAKVPRGTNALFVYIKQLLDQPLSTQCHNVQHWRTAHR